MNFRYCIQVLFATWNVNSLNARLPRVTEWLEMCEPDVVCLQETKMADDAFPALGFKELGYEAVHKGEGRWNGVAILSRVGLEKPVFDFSPELDTQARIVGAKCGGVDVFSVYVPNGRALDDDHYQFKLRWFAELRQYLDSNCDPSSDLIIAGDWNVAPEDGDVWDIGAFEGFTHVSEPERKAVQSIKDWGLMDTLRARFPRQEGLFSYYDYQAGRFHKRQGMRIDYVLSTHSLAERAKVDLVDRNARKGTKPSDHAPVLTYFED